MTEMSHLTDRFIKDIEKREQIYENKQKTSVKQSLTAVSYTHLDVYKRQPVYSDCTSTAFLIRRRAYSKCR